MKKGLTMGALLLVCLGLLWVGTWSGQAGVRRFVLAHRTELEGIAADCLSREETVERYWSARVDGLFPGELGSAVHGNRIRRILFLIRAAGGAVEHIIRGNLHDAAAVAGKV